MRALLQRVSEASVAIDGEVVGAIGRGYLVLLGVGKGDTEAHLEKLVDKICHLRLFPDEQGKMNLDVFQAGGSILCVSQFTLYADCKRGRRPGFSDSEEPVLAKAMWELFCARLRERGLTVETGRFGADMQVRLLNDGPVTIHLDSRELQAVPT